jgi:hypothetical protein
MNLLVAAALIVVGIIHLLPVMGALGAERLTQLYGLPFNDPGLLLLMRHRAILFGLLGVFFICAAFVPALRTPAFVAGFVSVASFLWLAWPAFGHGPQIRAVFTADLVALTALVIGGGVHFWSQFPK